jgi:hypothetical protein
LPVDGGAQLRKSSKSTRSLRNNLDCAYLIPFNSWDIREPLLTGGFAAPAQAFSVSADEIM